MISLEHLKKRVDIARMTKREEAKHMYWRGYPISEIAKIIGVNKFTIYSWKKKLWLGQHHGS